MSKITFRSQSGDGTTESINLRLGTCVTLKNNKKSKNNHAETISESQYGDDLSVSTYLVKFGTWPYLSFVYSNL